MAQTLHIKNMVCPRCITAVRQTLIRHGLHPTVVTLGQATVSETTLEPDVIHALNTDLKDQGFTILKAHDDTVVEKIKTAIISLVYDKGAETPTLSQYLQQTLAQDYSGLSKLFSEKTGQTIERYYINQRINRAKQLISYGELTLSEIALSLGYSSTAYFSSQFKQVTGMTPSAFKKADGAVPQRIDTL